MRKNGFYFVSGICLHHIRFLFRHFVTIPRFYLPYAKTTGSNIARDPKELPFKTGFLSVTTYKSLKNKIKLLTYSRTTTRHSSLLCCTSININRIEPLSVFNPQKQIPIADKLYKHGEMWHFHKY